MQSESSQQVSSELLECAICLLTMRLLRSTKSITALPCAHCFHTTCIDKLFKHAIEGEAKCPLCRQPIKTPAKITPPVYDSMSRSLELDIELHNLLNRRRNKKRKK